MRFLISGLLTGISLDKLRGILEDLRIVQKFESVGDEECYKEILEKCKNSGEIVRAVHIEGDAYDVEDSIINLTSRRSIPLGMQRFYHNQLRAERGSIFIER